MPSHMKSRETGQTKSSKRNKLRKQGRENKSIKVKRKKRTKSSSETSSDGSQGDLELDKQIYPVGHYLSDRAEMIEQMFSILEKDKIQSMLPPILKDVKWEDLKKYCLEQLNSMSEKQIIKILEGKPYCPDLEEEDKEKDVKTETISSSSSSTSSSSVESSSRDSSDSEPEMAAQETESKQINIKPDPDKVEDDPDMLQIGLSPKEMGDLLGEEEDNDKKQKEGCASEKKNTSTLPEKACEAKPGKTLLEILELEMRARAIRALLKQSASVNNTDRKGKGSPKKRSLDDVSRSGSETTAELEGAPSSFKDNPEVDDDIVIVKEEILSEKEEEDVVFVSESQLDSLSPKRNKKKAKKECLSAVYNVSADILKFKPTVMSTTSSVSVVDTSGKPIVLPKVKSHASITTIDPHVVVIDADTCDTVSSTKESSPATGDISSVGRSADSH